MEGREYAVEASCEGIQLMYCVGSIGIGSQDSGFRAWGFRVWGFRLGTKTYFVGKISGFWCFGSVLQGFRVRISHAF